MPHLKQPSLLLLAIGEPHQIFHVLGPAVELQRMGIDVACLVATGWHEHIIDRHAPTLSPVTRRTILGSHNDTLHACPPRLPNLVLSQGRMRGFDAVLTPERTSTALRKLCGRACPALIHIPHGAGDRAQSYDKRIKAFDLVLAAGEKDRTRFIERGLSRPDNTHSIGYVKFDVLEETLPTFFETDRPCILYNPHFDESLSSWLRMGAELVERFSRQTRYNVIIAPHLRIRGRSRALFNRLSERFQAPHLRFDAGSLHSVNMDYTRYADIYVGDASSQVYEFLQTPKPCVFLNPHRFDWKGDPHFRHWSFGDVVSDIEDVIPGIMQAADRHRLYADRQKRGHVAAIERPDMAPSCKAASIIRDYLRTLR